MFEQIAKIQEAALRDLYERVKRVADGMNGTCTEMELPSSLPGQMSDGASDLCVLALHVELPSGLVIDFKPQNALGIGNALSVIARRILPGSGTLSDRGFSFINGYWQSGGKALSDDEIRDCLTLRGPVPNY